MWRGRNLAFTLNDNTLSHILPCKEEETFLSMVTKAAELLLLKTAEWANEEISWSKELLLESPGCNQYTGLSCASLCISQPCWWPQAAPILNKQKVRACCHMVSAGSKEAEGASRLNPHLHSESTPWKWYKFLVCNPAIMDQMSTQLIYWRLKMPINHSIQ